MIDYIAITDGANIAPFADACEMTSQKKEINLLGLVHQDASTQYVYIADQRHRLLESQPKTDTGPTEYRQDKDLRRRTCKWKLKIIQYASAQHAIGQCVTRQSIAAHYECDTGHLCAAMKELIRTGIVAEIGRHIAATGRSRAVLVLI